MANASKVRDDELLKVSKGYDVAMFPKGAINNPALFASACILFDTVTLIKTCDVRAKCWKESGEELWTLTPMPNPSSEKFWELTRDLEKENTLISFEAPYAPEYRESFEGFENPLSVHGERCVDILSSNFFSKDYWYSLGFNDYFKHVERYGLSAVMDISEVRSSSHYKPEYPAKNVSTEGASLSARILSECIPELDISQTSPEKAAGKICDIRETTMEERIHYKSFIGLMSAMLAGPLTEEEKAFQTDVMVSDYKDVWEAYSSKLAEVARRLDTPLRFLSIAQSLATIDVIGAAEKVTETPGKTFLGKQETRSLGYVHKVLAKNDYWLKGG